MNKMDGMNYAPQGRPKPVVKPGEFVFSAAHIDHGHIYGMCNGLREAGGTLRYVYDPDPKKVEAFLRAYPEARAVDGLDQILEDRETQLVASSNVTSRRGPLGVKVMNAGKDYFSDKAPFTTMEQLNDAKQAVVRTGKKYMVYYSERLHVEGAILAGYMIDAGEIGRVISVTGFGPHRLGAAGRPKWFFEREKYGGILCDIGSHQIEQYLHFAGEEDATVQLSRVGNYAHPEYPELEDFGDCSLIGASGSTNYFRVDWFNPDGLRTWGDGRTFILGTEGFIEIRKYINLAADAVDGNHVYLVNGKGEQHFNATGMTGYPFFGQLILDCLNRTENAMTQAHALKAAELCLQAQAQALRVAGL